VSGKVGVAVVGVGFVGGQAHVPSFRKIEGCELIALCATTEKRVKPLAEHYGVKYVLDYDQLLEDPRVQAVVLAVPTPSHFTMAMKAIRRRKHVLCEMPLAPTAEEARRLGEAAAQEGVILMPVLQFRFAPVYKKTKELVDSGSVGRPLAVHYREFIPAESIASQWPAGSWAWNPEKSGGYPDFTLSVWSIDMLRWMFAAEVKHVEWMTNYARLEKYGGILGYNTVGVVKLTGGIVGTLHYSASVTQSASTTRLEVYGEEATLNAVWNNKIIIYGHEEKPKELDLPVKGTRVWGHRQLDEHFIECIRLKKQPEVTVDDAVKAIEIAKKINRQQRT
jgi:predicted dehydrogenase